MDAFLKEVRSVFRDWEARYRNEIGQITEPDVESQVSFIRHCVVSMALDGPTQQTLERIQDFLSEQNSGTEAPIRLSFWAGVHHGIEVHVNDFQDFDFADAWLIDGFDMICATRTRWTRQRIKEFLSVVREDFSFNGYVARIWIMDDQPMSQEICLGCIVLDASLGVFRQATIMQNVDQF